jgi:hypothetical protein
LLDFLAPFFFTLTGEMLIITPLLFLSLFLSLFFELLELLFFIPWGILLPNLGYSSLKCIDYRDERG